MIINKNQTIMSNMKKKETVFKEPIDYFEGTKNSAHVVHTQHMHLVQNLIKKYV